MKTRLNHEIKCFCPDFRPVRRILRQLGASRHSVKTQTDYFFHLPETPPGPGTKRLKMRFEIGRRELIYYYDRRDSGHGSVDFQLFDVRGTNVKDVLEAALGIKAIVKKRREVWRQGNAKFNLDTVEGVGKIFEIEVEEVRGSAAQRQLSEYYRRFVPYLGERVNGSNEDLVPKRDQL